MQWAQWQPERYSATACVLQCYNMSCQFEECRTILVLILVSDCRHTHMRAQPPTQHTHLALGPIQAVTAILNWNVASSPLNKPVWVDKHNGCPCGNKVLDYAMNQEHQNKH